MKLVGLVTIAVGLVACTGASVKESSSETDIVLCQSASFSGASSHFGRQTWLGSQTYFDEVNRSGGIKGRKMKVIAMDDQYEPDITAKNTQVCLADKNVFALFSYIGTPTLAKALPLLKQARDNGSQVFLFANRSGAGIQRTSPYDSMVFNVRASYGEETETIVRHFIKSDKKRFGMFIQDDAYGQSGLAGVESALAKRKKKVLDVAKYTRGTKFNDDFKQQVTQLLKVNADIIVSIASYQAAAGLIRDARDAGFKGPIVNISFVGAQDMLDLLIHHGQQNAKDYTQNLFVSQVLPPPTQTQIPIVAEYVKASQEHAPSIPSEIAGGEAVKPISIAGLEGYINAKVFTEIVRRVEGPLTQAAFMDAAHAFTMDLGFKMPLAFAKDQHQGLHEIWMTKVKNQKFVTAEE